MIQASELRERHLAYKKTLEAELERIDYILRNYVEAQDSEAFLTVQTIHFDAICVEMAKHGYEVIQNPNDDGKREHVGVYIKFA